MKVFLYSILAIFLFSCTSSTTNVRVEGLKVQLEDILVTLDPEKQIISAKIGNEDTYPIVNFSEYNTTTSDNFYCAISKSEVADDIVLTYQNGDPKQQLLIKKGYILALLSPVFFGGELKVATPTEVEEANNAKPVKIYTDYIDGIEHSFE